MHDWPKGFATFDDIQNAYGKEALHGEEYVPPTEDHDGYVERAVTVNRPIGEVYQFWRQLSNFPLFMKHVVSVNEMDATRSHWVVKGPAGVEVEWDAEIIEDVPEEILSWRSLPGADVENHGMVRFAQGPRGTEVRLRLRYSAPGGNLTDKIIRMFSGDPTEQARENMWRFKQLLEAGEIATIDGQSKGGES